MAAPVPPPGKYSPDWVKAYLWTQGVELLVYASFFLRLLIIYGLFFGVEYAIISMERIFLASNIQKHPQVAAVADLIEIGLGAVTIVAVAIHGVIGTIHLLRLETRLMSDSEDQLEGEQGHDHEQRATAQPQGTPGAEQPGATAS